jgi:hypothetical protein
MIKQNKNLGQMVAPVNKHTNVQLLLIVCDVIVCMLAKHIIDDFPRFFEGTSTQKSLVPLEIANFVFCPDKQLPPA